MVKNYESSSYNEENSGIETKGKLLHKVSYIGSLDEARKIIIMRKNILDMVSLNFIVQKFLTYIRIYIINDD